MTVRRVGTAPDSHRKKDRRPRMTKARTATDGRAFCLRHLERERRMSVTTVEHAPTNATAPVPACDVRPVDLDGEQAAKDLRHRVLRDTPVPGRDAGGEPGYPGSSAEGRLGTTTDFVSPSGEKKGSDLHKCGTGTAPCCRRRRRYEARRVIWSITGVKRLSACGRVMAHGQDGQQDRVRIHLRDGVAYTSGVCICANTWLCPVCSAKIRTARANEIALGVSGLILKGGSAWMVTFTVRHAKNQALAELLDALNDAFRKLGTGKMAMKEKAATGRIGTINSREITYGKNGWHPHLHVIVCFDTEPDLEALVHMMHRWQRVWMAWTKKHGFPANKRHGVKWDKVMTAEGAGEYIAKAQDSGRHIGNEVARGDLKKGRLGSLTPFELIEYLAATGDAAVVPLWQEYEKAVKGKSPIRWSQGLKDLLGVKQVDDEEHAAEEVEGSEFAELTESAWKMVVLHKLEARILEAVERGGFDELVKLLTAHQIWAVKKLSPTDTEVKGIA